MLEFGVVIHATDDTNFRRSFLRYSGTDATNWRGEQPNTPAEPLLEPAWSVRCADTPANWSKTWNCWAMQAQPVQEARDEIARKSRGQWKSRVRYCLRTDETASPKEHS